MNLARLNSTGTRDNLSFSVPVIIAMYKIIAIAVFASFAAAPARAQAIDSAYTTHDFEKCALVRDDDPVTERRCVGYAGIPIFWVNEPDSSSIGFGTS